ncbi:MAG: hypothetical protein ACK4JD_08985 [Thermoflexales bacterium]
MQRRPWRWANPGDARLPVGNQAMIPKRAKRQAIVMTLVSFGLLAIGIILGLLWVSAYSVK